MLACSLAVFDRQSSEAALSARRFVRASLRSSALVPGNCSIIPRRSRHICDSLGTLATLAGVCSTGSGVGLTIAVVGDGTLVPDGSARPSNTLKVDVADGIGSPSVGLVEHPDRTSAAGIVSANRNRLILRSNQTDCSRRISNKNCEARPVFPYLPDLAGTKLPSIEQVCESLGMASTETSPQRCPNGHPLAANTCLVGWEVCGCMTAHNGGHRTHYCRRCGETIRTPECAGASPQKSRWRQRL